MKVLDTHVVLWLALDQRRISRKAKSAIEEARRTGEGLAISDITLFEIANADRKQRISLDAGLGSFLSEVERRFTVLPITAQVSVRVNALPHNYPKDPADRIIGATALVQGAALITADDAIRRSRALSTIW